LVTRRRGLFRGEEDGLERGGVSLNSKRKFVLKKTYYFFVSANPTTGGPGEERKAVKGRERNHHLGEGRKGR